MKVRAIHGMLLVDGSWPDGWNCAWPISPPTPPKLPVPKLPTPGNPVPNKPGNPIPGNPVLLNQGESRLGVRTGRPAALEATPPEGPAPGSMPCIPLLEACSDWSPKCGTFFLLFAPICSESKKHETLYLDTLSIYSKPKCFQVSLNRFLCIHGAYQEIRLNRFLFSYEKGDSFSV
jgi:hypothetical protein